MAGTRMHVVISGRVQGVFFRANTKQNAEKRGVTGWVKNRADGKVEAVFEGEKDDVKELLEWCRHGPRLARVTNVEYNEGDPTGEFDTFAVRR